MRTDLDANSLYSLQYLSIPQPGSFCLLYFELTSLYSPSTFPVSQMLVVNYAERGNSLEQYYFADLSSGGFGSNARTQVSLRSHDRFLT